MLTSRRTIGPDARRWLVGVATISTLGAVALATTNPAGAAPVARTATTAAASPSSHAYSDPIWYPLRHKGMVGCITSNCPHKDHKGFAINIDSKSKKLGHDPVYAMGAGILHVGKPVLPHNCGSSHSPTLGRWAWVDHGGGVVSEYLHLNGIARGLHSGDYVTPRTRLGSVGNTGDNHCGTPYLDFFVRHGGVHGQHAVIHTLQACQGSSRVSYPSAFDHQAKAWSEVRYKTVIDHDQDNSCLPTSFAAAPALTKVRAKPAHNAAVVSWAAPATNDAGARGSVRVEFAMYHPSTHAYNASSYATAAAAAGSLRVSSLTTKRLYRFRGSVHNKVGWSHPSGWRTVTVH